MAIATCRSVERERSLASQPFNGIIHLTRFDVLFPPEKEFFRRSG